MVIREFGRENPRHLLYFQGSCEPWTEFRESAELLGERFHVMLVTPDGHDPIMRHFLKEMPHNTATHLAVPFLPVISCRFFDLPPGLASPFSLKTLHRSVFRALEPSKPSKSARAPDKKFTHQLTTLIVRYFLMPRK